LPLPGTPHDGICEECGRPCANQRKAIIAGLKDSIEDFSKAVAGATAQDVMQLVLITQYFDTLKDIAGNDRTNTVLVPHSPNTINDLFGQFRDTLVASHALSSPPDGAPPLSGRTR